jgi:hypothetical protein
MEEIVATAVEMTRRYPIQIFLFGSIIIRAIQKREQPHRVPAQRLNEARWNFVLPIVVSDGFAKKIFSIRRAQSFKRIRVQARSADPRENGIEQTFRQQRLAHRDKIVRSVR